MALALHSARGRGVLLASVLGSGVAFLDGTVVNVALPTLERELSASLAGLQWVVDAYLVTLGALVLSGGSLGDRLGRRRVFVVGLAWFAAASALCGLAPGITTLIAARALQGVGAALLVPGSLAVLRTSLDESDQAEAIGDWAGLSGVTTALGPLLGGWLVAIDFRLIFFLNLPLAAVAIWAALRCVPESTEQGGPGGAPPRIDWAGSLLAALGLGGIVFALIEGPALGLGSPRVIGSAAAGLAALAAFFVVEARSPAPMLPLAIFRSRAFSSANATTFAVYFAFGGALFLLGLQLQNTLGYSPLAAGAAFTPITLLLLLLSPAAGKLSARTGPRLPMTLGPLIVACGLALGARITAGATYAGAVLPCAIAVGLGLATTVAPLTSAALSFVPSNLAGIASGVNNAVARIASLLAVAFLPLVSGMAHVASRAAPSASAKQGAAASAAALALGFPRAMRISAALCALGALVAFTTLARLPGAQPRTEGAAP